MKDVKIALYIEDGLEQIVLTPQSDTEKAILKKLRDDDRVFEIKGGSFYECRGGYVRHRMAFYSQISGQNVDDDSTIIVLRPKPAENKEEITGSVGAEMEGFPNG